MYQDINLINELNVIENICLPLDILRQSIDIEYEKEVVSMLKLEGLEKKYQKQLPGGERQRTAVARAMVKKPSVILADEPNGNLDNNAGIELMEYVSKSSRLHGQTFLIATHDEE